MAQINTVRGPVDTSQLGATLMHEHVFVLSTEIMQNYPEAWGDEEQRISDAVNRLNELHATALYWIDHYRIVNSRHRTAKAPAHFASANLPAEPALAKPDVDDVKLLLTEFAKRDRKDPAAPKHAPVAA